MASSPPVNVPLTRLEQADLIRRLQELGDAYQFKHTMVQESAYMSLLRNDRRNLHRACARALEETFAGELDTYAALLSQHYAEAGDEHKTLEYARRAGDAARRVFAHDEALMHYDTAALLAAHLPVEPDTLCALHLQRGRTLELMGRYDDAVEAYRALQTIGQAKGESRIELAALLALATLYTFPNNAQNLEEALRANRRALELARQTGDEQSEARALWNCQQYAYFTGKANEAVAFSKQALAIADRLGLHELRAYILNDSSRSLMSVESVSSALAVLAEARAIWRETNNLPMLVDNLSTSAETSAVVGDLEAAESFALQTQELSQTIGNLWNLAYSCGNLLQIYATRGESERALALYAQTVRFSEQSNFFVAAVIAKILCATIWGELGNVRAAIEFLQTLPPIESFLAMEGWRLGTIASLQLLDRDVEGARVSIEKARRVVQMEDLSTFGPIYVSLSAAELALQEQRYDDAITGTDPLVKQLRSLGIRSMMPELLFRQARAFMGLGDTAAAAVALQEGQAIAQFMQARPILWQLSALDAELQAQGGNTERAGSLRANARDIVTWLGEHAPAEFRESFLTQPHVRAVMEF